MSRILLVEDEASLGRALVLGLCEDGFVVDHERDGESGLHRATHQEYALILLDIRLPRLDGIRVCRQVRAEGIATPILMLTACDTTDEVINGLDAGADDYLTKPFEFKELLARVRALLRRSTRTREPFLSCGDLHLDIAERRVRRGETEIRLSRMELAVLEHLLLHSGVPQSKDQIAAAVWKDDTDISPNALEVCISSLRRKLQLPGLPALIHTRRGAGYFADALSNASDGA